MRGTTVARLTGLAGASCVLLGVVSGAQASFPGNDGKIVFVSTRDGSLDYDDTGEAEIYSMQPDGTAQTRLTVSAGDDIDPVWSADGTSIAFASDRTGDYELYTMNADGTNQTQLTRSAGPDFGPAFSPDGKKIVFVTTRHGKGEVYVYDLTGGTQTRLTSNDFEDHSPVWAPNGTKIAFVSDRNGDEEIYVMNVDGSSVTNLTSNSAPDYAPDWSPDSLKLVFISDRDGMRPAPGDPVAGEIYEISLVGTVALRMTINTEYENHPSFSNDGSRIGFTRSTLTARDEVYWMLELAGALRWNLSSNVAQDYTPDYRPS